MAKDTTSEKTTGGALNVREVQPPHLTDRELKQDQSEKRESERKEGKPS
ncbi:hypothetical protein ABID21_003800 [Pseudorhizobium tarimense]|uniref:Uncharacterized protein n=1 Tax=Pseudorhizobium tarimense TaxID=1079109 RepID=A0ABV2HB80_9HYPH|nr:hypothetical protein [Pseudorhizobium tarimense]MCJ8520788.1 hypothetical protein [Pseudorhizobium tarimense]